MSFLIFLGVGFLIGQIFYSLARKRKMIKYGYMARAMVGAAIGRILSAFFAINSTYYLNKLIFDLIFAIVFVILGEVD